MTLLARNVVLINIEFEKMWFSTSFDRCHALKNFDQNGAKTLNFVANQQNAIIDPQNSFSFFSKLYFKYIMNRDRKNI